MDVAPEISSGGDIQDMREYCDVELGSVQM